MAAWVAVAYTLTAAAHAEELWKAPPEAAARQNPIKPSIESIDAGRGIYQKRCEKCHGERGEGDGPAGEILSRKPADFTGSAFEQETDGGLFWKIRTGKKPMPRYGIKLSDHEIWNVINFLRTFSSRE